MTDLSDDQIVLLKQRAQRAGLVGFVQIEVPAEDVLALIAIIEDQESSLTDLESALAASEAECGRLSRQFEEIDYDA